MITLDKLEELIERLPALYERHGRTPADGCHVPTSNWKPPRGYDDGCGCALEIIALELGLPSWQDVLTDLGSNERTYAQQSDIMEAFYRAFDGHPCPWLDAHGDVRRAYDLGVKARKKVGLP